MLVSLRTLRHIRGNIFVSSVPCPSTSAASHAQSFSLPASYSETIHSDSSRSVYNARSFSLRYFRCVFVWSMFMVTEVGSVGGSIGISLQGIVSFLGVLWVCLCELLVLWHFGLLVFGSRNGVVGVGIGQINGRNCPLVVCFLGVFDRLRCVGCLCCRPLFLGFHLDLCGLWYGAWFLALNLKSCNESGVGLRLLYGTGVVRRRFFFVWWDVHVFFGIRLVRIWLVHLSILFGNCLPAFGVGVVRCQHVWTMWIDSARCSRTVALGCYWC